MLLNVIVIFISSHVNSGPSLTLKVHYWYCWHCMQSRVYVTVRCPSVCPFCPPHSLLLGARRLGYKSTVAVRSAPATLQMWAVPRCQVAQEAEHVVCCCILLLLRIAVNRPSCVDDKWCCYRSQGGSVAEWLACWTQVQKGLGSNRSRDAVGYQS